MVRPAEVESAYHPITLFIRFSTVARVETVEDTGAKMFLNVKIILPNLATMSNQKPKFIL